MTAALVVGARRLPATNRHAALVMVRSARHAHEITVCLRAIPGARTTTLPVPAGRTGVTQVVEAAIARVAVRSALITGPALGAAVGGVAWAASPYGTALAAVMGATVALTGGLFAGGFAGFIVGLARYEKLLSTRGDRRAGDIAVVVRGVPCKAVIAAVDGDVLGCCDELRPVEDAPRTSWKKASTVRSEHLPAAQGDDVRTTPVDLGVTVKEGQTKQRNARGEASALGSRHERVGQPRTIEDPSVIDSISIDKMRSR